MFVMNCSVDSSELLKYPYPNKKRKKKKQKSCTTQDTSSETEEKFHPVRCNECNTVVAVYDTDEIYHFFNVLASYWMWR